MICCCDFLTQPEKSLLILLDCIEKRTQISGYQLNWNKYEALPLSGYCLSINLNPLKFPWSQKGIKYIHVTLDYKEMVQDNISHCFIISKLILVDRQN